MTLFLSTLLYALFALLNLAVIAHLLSTRRPTQSLIFWVLVMLLLPFLGPLLYVLFGSRKLFGRHSKRPLTFDCATDLADTTPLGRMLARCAMPPARPGNRAAFTFDPAQARDWFSEAITNARERIWLESYIFATDRTGRRLIRALADKARQGVDVRLLIDGVGSLQVWLRPGLFRELREAGGQVAFFQPLTHPLRGAPDLRNHRKIYLFDHHTLLVGGINLASEYLDPDAPGHWVDFTCRVSGPVLADHEALFRQDWAWATGETLPATVVPPPAGEALMRLVPTGPDTREDTVRDALVQAIVCAREEVLIVTPYFIPDEQILQAVLIACKAGVRVRLLTPARTDNVASRLGRAHYMRELAEAGAEIGCYTPTMLHAKVFVIDRQLALVGSANLDYRSMLRNYELMDIVLDAEFIARLRDEVERLWRDSVPYVSADSGWVRMGENLFRLFTPMM